MIVRADGGLTRWATGTKASRTFSAPPARCRSRLPVRVSDTVTLALTYGPKVDWYRNVVAAGGCRMRMGREILTLGAPRTVTPEQGMARMPAFAKVILPRAGVTDFVELPVLSARPVSR